MKLTLKEIAGAAKAKMLEIGNVGEVTSVSIDTRTMKKGDLYVAIKGAHFDGHGFIEQAIEKGACGVVLSEKEKVKGKKVAVLEVEDTVKALGDIANLWRKKLDLTCIAITGSNGKSTTKEMVSSAISPFRKVIKTEGNFNNLIGLPLQVMRIASDDEVAVMEMGMNAPGEITSLAKIAEPTIGLITNVNPAHLEKLHTVENVARAKGELFDAMNGKGTIVVNAEDPWVVKLAKDFKGQKITFGMQNDCDIRFGKMTQEGLESVELTFYYKGREYFTELPVPGVHNVMNALAAIAVGVAAGCSVPMMIPALEKFQAMKMRFERVQLLNGVQLVNDCYNANPSSMYAALRTIGAAKRAGRFIAVLGDMLELGEAAREKHQELGRNAAELGVNKLFVIGDLAEDVARGAKERSLEASVMNGFEQLKEGLLSEIRTGDIVLIKGSRGMKMEQVAEFLKNEIGA